MEENKTQLQVPFVDFKRRYALHREEILSAVDAVFSSGNYIFGEWTEACEKQLSDYLQTPYVLTVANGTDAIILALKVLEIGASDEVIIPVNSFVATAGAVVAVGAKPVFCDVSDDLNINVNEIEKHITAKTKAIIPVHLTGRPVDMSAITAIATQHHLFVIEDAAQSIGAKFQGKMTGTIGDFGCFSLHPLKNLHVYGDGGIVVAKNQSHYAKLQLLRNHGLKDRDTCTQWGLNSRLDAVQAKLVSVGLKYLDQWNEKRRLNASKYHHGLHHLVKTPTDHHDIFSVYHNFVIQSNKRDALAQFLKNNGVDTRVHYPVPLHLQPAAKNLGYRLGDFPVAERLMNEMLSLPVHPELRDEEVNCVIEKITKFVCV
ncbi:MAG: hypothetical protein A3I77_03880 [Gammaproteobacteria bacterium RIFCSPLOWO2_02_FULL_42_14]|nr:MAG: hypothetical protein A3B71_05185 [Gammaproteobacteria bacterium RIFCSPHIGHO2_02_FULL_42_43]OGT28575.1 MAG: hypothetical protein A2624_04025 [Gammaproteobacteria bacterium RIFCSPHIGHO2_01_FULL_42_8]OGT51602.1 MAG: hypothetical protein A3E54_04950 [Gammaproteobacteria bacterium RIFCSPHIGHO2_12_FULL_41_25]OGT62301.1 MAG: hypothetical protein A3I77_03880 [Gammaproteobacteria bacterium RIFCSPLOWO2_02_FULL_42_14]OGT85976.1 MAG: hypothetical protein A3G86_03575 [Gammaproteobacteria bacterium R